MDQRQCPIENRGRSPASRSIGARTGRSSTQLKIERSQCSISSSLLSTHEEVSTQAVTQ
jgi:hypothetical protein